MCTADNYKLPIKPLKGRILAVRHVKSVGEFKQGIIIPSDNKIKSQEVKIVALGDPIIDSFGIKSTFEVVVGDRVLINKYSGIEIKTQGHSYLLLKEEDLLVKLN